MEIFKLKASETFVELNNLLQIMSWVGSGGEAKMRIKEGEVQVNDEVELRVRKKVRSGEVVKLGPEMCRVD